MNPQGSLVRSSRNHNNATGRLVVQFGLMLLVARILDSRFLFPIVGFRMPIPWILDSKSEIVRDSRAPITLITTFLNQFPQFNLLFSICCYYHSVV